MDVGVFWDFAQDNHFLVAITIVALYILKSFIWVIPMNFLYLSAGLLLPTVYAVAVTYMGLYIEMSIGYLIGIKYGQKYVKDAFKKRRSTQWLLSVIDKNMPLGCFLTRLLPGAPVDVASMLFGSLKVPYAQHMFFSLLGVSPFMLTIVVLGKAAFQPLSPKFIALVVVIIIVFIFHTFFWRKKSK